MDLFKFATTNADKTVLENGMAINGYSSAMWTERYAEPGSLEIKGKLSSGLKDFLPEGTFVGHIDTMEVMIVENHEINETRDEDPDLTITGRTMPSYLENRIAGTNQARTSSLKDFYTLPDDYTWNQVVKLINDHINSPAPVNDRMGNVTAINAVTGTSGTSEERDPSQKEILGQVLEILAIDDLGIKTIRKNPFTGFGGDPDYTSFIVYRGTDRSNKIIFSWDAGDLESADYLFSGKKWKTSAVVFGRYVQVVVDTTGYTGYNRRFMVVDGSDVDGHLDAVPTGATLTAVTNKLTTRGRQKLKSQRRVSLSRTDVSNITKYQYRRDYNLGDMVTLQGNFGQFAKMMVVEHVEIDDENGESSHPTLSFPEED